MRKYLIFLFILPIPLHGKHYACTAKHFYLYSASGELISKANFPAKSFTIDKKNGRMSGDLQNYNQASAPQIVSKGSASHSLRIITTYKGPYPSMDTLTINEHLKGNKKPFIFQKGSAVYSGVCQIK